MNNISSFCLVFWILFFLKKLIYRFVLFRRFIIILYDIIIKKQNNERWMKKGYMWETKTTAYKIFEFSTIYKWMRKLFNFKLYSSRFELFLYSCWFRYLLYVGIALINLARWIKIKLIIFHCLTTTKKWFD